MSIVYTIYLTLFYWIIIDHCSRIMYSFFERYFKFIYFYTESFSIIGLKILIDKSLILYKFQLVDTILIKQGSLKPDFKVLFLMILKKSRIKQANNLHRSWSVPIIKWETIQWLSGNYGRINIMKLQKVQVLYLLTLDHMEFIYQCIITRGRNGN